MKYFLSRSRNVVLFLFSVAGLLAGGTVALRGQSALDGFNPNANGEIRAVVVQPDGKILIGGTFTSLAPNSGAAVTRNHIARLNPDGTLDLAFNPNANFDVTAIALQADGKILVGGYFFGANSIGGATRNYIARLDAVTGSADSFDPNANNAINAIAVQAGGEILVGGLFNGANSIGGQMRNYIARLDAVTGLADSFDPNANATVFAIAIQADGKILAGGNFSGTNSIGGAVRNRIARLDAATGLADSFDPNANGPVFAIAVQADGKILAGGDFSGANSIGGAARNRIARLDATTSLADSFNPNANDSVLSIAVQADGRILAGGVFLGANSIGGATRNHIARLDAATGTADSFNPNAGGNILSIAVQADGKILAGGSFFGIGGQFRNNIARLETDGGIDRTLNLSAVGISVSATAVQPDGKILIGGTFTSVLGVPRTNVARLNTDGTLDTAFNPNANNDVQSIAVQADGKILVGGYFTSIGGQTRNRLARLNPDGSTDSFDPNVSGAYVSSIAVQADSKILVGGNFTGIGGEPRNRIARLDATTGLADSFNPNPNSLVYAIALQSDGRILAGGDFTSIGGQMRNRIARLDPDTGLADSFNPNANDTVFAIAVQADGKILAGGTFTSIDIEPRDRIARLDSTSGLADSFDPGADDGVYTIAVQADGKILVGGDFTSIGIQTRDHIALLDATSGSAAAFFPPANATVYSIALQADGKILVGGLFTSIGGQSRNAFARLSNDTAALQNLVMTPTAITWTRGGSSPQLTRVTFESSTNNVNYTLLGNGTEAGSNWTLTGLSLPVGQNIFVRARGYYSGGIRNGSDSITESVRNVFLVATPLPLLNIQRSVNTDVVLSWPTNFPGFTLEAKTNINTNIWSVVSPAPAVSGTNNVVTNAASGSERFYRLRK